MLFGEVTEEPVTVTQAELQALPREQQIALIASLPEAQQEELIDATFSPLLRIGVKAEIAKKAAGSPTRVAYEEEVWEEELEPDLAADLDNIKMKHAAAFGGGSDFGTDAASLQGSAAAEARVEAVDVAVGSGFLPVWHMVHDCSCAGFSANVHAEHVQNTPA